VEIVVETDELGLKTAPSKILFGAVGELRAIPPSASVIRNNKLVITLSSDAVATGERRVRLEFRDEPPVEFGFFSRKE
jgi:hypothetical protein